MEKSFNTQIVFKHSLSDKEQFAVLKSALRSIGRLAVSEKYHFENKLDCSVDYSNSRMNEKEVKKSFTRFLKTEKERIQYFSFSKSA